MLRFLADVCFDGSIFRTIRRHAPNLDIVRAQDVGMGAAPDPMLLDWAAGQSRLVLSHDVNTLVGYANDRTDSGRPMPGLIIVSRTITVGQAADEIILLAECSRDGEWEGQIIFLPF